MPSKALTVEGHAQQEPSSTEELAAALPASAAAMQQSCGAAASQDVGGQVETSTAPPQQRGSPRAASDALFAVQTASPRRQQGRMLPMKRSWGAGATKRASEGSLPTITEVLGSAGSAPPTGFSLGALVSGGKPPTLGFKNVLGANAGEGGVAGRLDSRGSELSSVTAAGSGVLSGPSHNDTAVGWAAQPGDMSAPPDRPSLPSRRLSSMASTAGVGGSMAAAKAASLRPSEAGSGTVAPRSASLAGSSSACSSGNILPKATTDALADDGPPLSLGQQHAEGSGDAVERLEPARESAGPPGRQPAPALPTKLSADRPPHAESAGAANVSARPLRSGEQADDAPSERASGLEASLTRAERLHGPRAPQVGIDYDTDVEFHDPSGV